MKPSQALARWAGVRMRGVVGTATGLLALMVLLGVYTGHRGPLPGEHRLYDHPLAVTFASRQAADAERVLVGLGRPGIAVVLVAAIAGLLVLVGERTGAALVIGAGAVAAISGVVKLLFGRHPLQHLAPVAHYPSGHVSFVSAVFGMTGLLAIGARRPILAACCAVPILGIGFAVLIGGGHVPSDVVGGYLLAAAWLLVLVAAVSRLARAQNR